MIVGEIYWANVPFENRPGSKIRPVVILNDEPTPTVLVVSSTTQVKSNLDLLLSINFDSPRYYRCHSSGLRGKSYLYRENVQEMDPQIFVRLAGVLRPDDLTALLDALA